PWGVGVRMKKGRRARVGVGGAKEEKEERGDCRGSSGGDPLPGKSGDKENRRGDKNNVHRCAKVWLCEDQCHTKKNRTDRRKNILQKILFAEFKMDCAFAL